jgi:hypothetical protein
MNRLKRSSQLIIALLCLALIPMTAPCGVVLASAEPNKLFIDILDGEGALNDIRGRTAREPVVQVEDENHKPVAGALVLFTLPSSGPGATFSNGLTTLRVTTGADGKATAQGFKPNSMSGQYQIQIQASFGGISTVAVINETNVGASNAVAKHSATRAIPIKVLVIGAAAVATGITLGILETRGHTDTITAQSPSVGPPLAQ